MARQAPDYTPIPENWYKAKPYCFRAIDHGGDRTDFYLPINPSNLNITTHFATNVISTMYGTVEEHSEQRYYDIVIQGTTGFAPQNYEEKILGKIKKPIPGPETTALKNLGIIRDSQPGRSTFFKADTFTTGGFFKRTQALVRAAISGVKDLFGGDAGYVSAIDEDKTGYMAFHNFYKFLLAYKEDVVNDDNNNRRRTGDNGDNHPLRFINYKDNNQYNVAIQTFTLLRSLDDPMLYNYNITMRAYKLSDVKVSDVADVGADLVALGLDGVESSSKFAKMSNIARQAKNTAYIAVAAVKGVGT